jgi:ABC-type Fe3+-siderophore transport system permease subunit
VLIAFLAGVVLAQVDWYAMQFFPSKPGDFSVERFQFLWEWQWSTVVAFFLAGGMLAATLLIYRTLGYRLCRHKLQR